MKEKNEGRTGLCSIILPVYNVDKYLAECLESITVQTYKKLEIIVVIDGATDNSLSIAEKFARKDSRINVLWQENTGSGPARNLGLVHAHGEFIFFVDPDDWISNDYVERMLEIREINDADLVLSTPIKCYFNKQLQKKGEKKQFIEDMQVNNLHDVRNLHTHFWGKGLLSAPHCKVYRSSLINDFNIRFPDFRRSQDIAFNIDYYTHVSRICQTSYSGYFYRLLFGENNYKYRIDYYHIIKVLYRKLEEMYINWDIPMDNREICKILYGGIYGLVEACIARNEDFRVFLEDETIRNIVKNANPPTRNLAIAKKMICNRDYEQLKWYVKLAYHIKKIMRNHSF